jgi:deoxyribonuclease IV
MRSSTQSSFQTSRGRRSNARSPPAWHRSSSISRGSRPPIRCSTARAARRCTGTTFDSRSARSFVAFGIELARAETLGLLGVVIRPGCYTDGTEEDGLRLVASAVSEVLKPRRHGRTLVLLEHTAGQGTSLGWRFEQLSKMLEHLDGHPRVGVCLDSCHLFGAGYDLSTEEGYAATFESFERLVGLDRLRVWHLNDSKRELGSRRDRHDHIGKGLIGLSGFRRIVNDARFAGLPMVMETPKTEGRRPSDTTKDPLDIRNLRTLRGLFEER